MTENHPMRRAPAVLAAVTHAMLVPACSGEDGPNAAATAEASDETLAALLAGDAELSVVADARGDAGLARVFDGTAAYTIFAPRDDAFEALGEAGADLRAAEQRAAMVAVLRDHVVPGYLTPADIAKAIEIDADGSVQMRTMGGHVLTFTSEGDTVIATAEDGARARLVNESLRGSNGVAVPIDAVLKRVAPQPAA